MVGDILDGFGMIMHTTNGGVLWIRQGSLSTVPNAKINSVFVVDRNTAWFAGDSSALFYTTDQGETFQPAMLDSIPPACFSKISASGNHIWVVGFSTGGTLDNSSALVLCSDDAGMTWFVQGAGSNFPDRFYDVHAVNDTVVFISGSGYRPQCQRDLGS